jgi:hypothetical protein
LCKQALNGRQQSSAYVLRYGDPVLYVDHALNAARHAERLLVIGPRGYFAADGDDSGVDFYLDVAKAIERRKKLAQTAGDLVVAVRVRFEGDRRLERTGHTRRRFSGFDRVAYGGASGCRRA